MVNTDLGHVHVHVRLVRLTRETGHARHARISVVSRFVTRMLRALGEQG